MSRAPARAVASSNKRQAATNFFCNGSGKAAPTFFSSATANLQRKCKDCEAKDERRIQRKLTVGKANDRFEQEADRIADQVMATGLQGPSEAQPTPGLQRQATDQSVTTSPIPINILPAVQRERAPELDNDDEQLQAKSDGSPDVLRGTAASIQGLRGGGQPLSAGTRQFFERSMGYDFGSVRVHTGGHADGISRSIGARAFTVGRDVAFAAGQYAPENHDGRRLLAHELTHVVQQQGRSGRTIQRQTDPRVEACMADTQHLLPQRVGLLTHMMRETQLESTLGSDRAMLEAQIRRSHSARRFVCEAGVPAIVALYDTRRARIELEVQCARQALARHPNHYNHAALRLGRRHLLLRPMFASFRRRTDFFTSATARSRTGRLEVGRRLQLLSPNSVSGRFKVRVISGPRHCEEGYVRATDVIAPTATTIASPRRVRLVFMENPERIGSTILEVGAGITSRRTRLRVPQPGGGDRFYRIARRRKFSVERAGHTQTELHVKARVGGSRIPGFLPRAHTMNDLDFRRSERRFFVSIARTISRDRRGIFVDPESQTCIAEPHPIEFFTGDDIARGIVGAANCTNSLVDEIHIVGHGGTHGMPGTGDFAQLTGLYVQSLQNRVHQHMGAMTARAFVDAIHTSLANGVQVWIHACKTAENYRDAVAATATAAAEPRIPGFAEQLAGELRRSGRTQATVGALPGRGPANSGYVRRKRFVVYPGGRRRFL